MKAAEQTNAFGQSIDPEPALRKLPDFYSRVMACRQIEGSPGVSRPDAQINGITLSHSSHPEGAEESRARAASRSDLRSCSGCSSAGCSSSTANSYPPGPRLERRQ